MKTLLLATFLKPGVFESYKKFTEEIMGPRKKEYKEMMKRYGLHTAHVWHEKVSDKDYIMVVHEAEDDALEKLKNWSSSTDPFDLWFAKHLDQYYEKFPDPSHLLYQIDTRQ